MSTLSSDNFQNYTKTACTTHNQCEQFDSDTNTVVSTSDATEIKMPKDTTENFSHDTRLSTLKKAGEKIAISQTDAGTDLNFKRKVHWRIAIFVLWFHVCGLIGFGLCLLGYVKVFTMIYTFVLGYASFIGVTMGAHRLFSHRSFKAKRPLRILLLGLYTLTGQNHLYMWVQDHRQHHKYSDTDPDPYNASRGFFFSHVGWIISRRHRKVHECAKKIDMSDIEADKWIMLQKNHYLKLFSILSLVSVAIPIYAWGENPTIALFVAFFFRVVFILNTTFLVNSAAHLYGTRPFDRSILPAQNWFLGFLAIGEGWHNYHHAFPYDYRSSELGLPFDVTSFLIDCCAYFGWATDRKEASHNTIKSRIVRTGDGSLRKDSK